MTSKKKFLLILAFSFGSLLIVIFNKDRVSTLTQTPESKIGSEATSGDGKRTTIDKQRNPIANVTNLKFVNTPSPQWKDKLHSSLLLQGGKRIKEIKIQKEKSLVWMRDENPLLVESVIIVLKNDKDIQSSFRALVDSQTGKILESWDQTHFDNFDKKNQFALHPDSSYSN